MAGSAVLLGRGDGAVQRAPAGGPLPFGGAGAGAGAARGAAGTVANVVFPTGIDRRDDLGPPERFDVYYGMADDRIGVARLEVPEDLPTGGPPGSPGAKV